MDGELGRAAVSAVSGRKQARSASQALDPNTTINSHILFSLSLRICAASLNTVNFMRFTCFCLGFAVVMAKKVPGPQDYVFLIDGAVNSLPLHPLALH